MNIKVKFFALIALFNIGPLSAEMGDDLSIEIHILCDRSIGRLAAEYKLTNHTDSPIEMKTMHLPWDPGSAGVNYSLKFTPNGEKVSGGTAFDDHWGVSIIDSGETIYIIEIESRFPDFSEQIRFYGGVLIEWDYTFPSYVNVTSHTVLGTSYISKDFYCECRKTS